MRTLVEMYRFYGLLTGSNKTSGGISIIPGVMAPAQRHVGSLMPAQPGCLAVEIVPDIHNPAGRYTESASIRVYDPAEKTLTSNARTLVELQGLFSPDPTVPSRVIMFKLSGANHIGLGPFFEALVRFDSRPVL